MGAKKRDSVSIVAYQMKQLYERNAYFSQIIPNQKTVPNISYKNKLMTLLFYYNFGRQVFNKQNRFCIIYFFCQKYIFVRNGMVPL